MNKTKITISDKNGTKTYIGTVKELIEVLELSEIAEDMYIDQCNEWK